MQEVAGNMDTISEGMNFKFDMQKRRKILAYIFHFLSLWVLNVSATHFCLHVSCN